MRLFLVLFLAGTTSVFGQIMDLSGKNLEKNAVNIFKSFPSSNEADRISLFSENRLKLRSNYQAPVFKDNGPSEKEITKAIFMKESRPSIPNNTISEMMQRWHKNHFVKYFAQFTMSFGDGYQSNSEMIGFTAYIPDRRLSYGLAFEHINERGGYHWHRYGNRYYKVKNRDGDHYMAHGHLKWKPSDNSSIEIHFSAPIIKDDNQGHR